MLLALPASAALSPAAAQSANDCAPYCDYRHYYGVQNYTWDAPGRFCRPICDAAGNCLPTKTCVRAEPRTRVVGGVVGPVTAIAGNTSVTFYDPSIATEPVARPLRSPPRGRAPIVRVRPYVPPR
ncbi:hypothetical protein A33M_0815 [Rhodovulum sp. PH10]|nr:hypothetical protein A33M_0815 [Rhodovulum sp. PH10]